MAASTQPDHQTGTMTFDKLPCEFLRNESIVGNSNRFSYLLALMLGCIR